MKNPLPLCLAALLTLYLSLPGLGLTQPPPEERAEIAYSPQGADTCLLCHIAQPAVLAIFDSKHAVPTDPRSPFGDGQLQCEACHGPGGAHLRPVRPRIPVIRHSADSVTSVSARNETCLSCHDGGPGFGWHGGPHDDNQVACADCHTIHTGRDAVLHAATQPDICYECHQSERAASIRAYSHPLRSSEMGCTACHSPHGATTELQLVRQTVNDTCYQCHAEKRGPFLWEHAPVAEDCTLCHAPHGSNQPGMLTQRAPFLCQSCHSQAGHPSLMNDANGLPSGSPSTFLLGQSCTNCHSQVHGSNHPSGSKLMR
jgi:DmsE family decaheme c-type cytochrome